MVVIGGGVVGSGCALDAATRGLKVALVEARDFASGTSSRSSKMFHGGLRYLEQLEFGLVREALYERELSLTTLAPHLVKPMPFLFPLTKRMWERPYIAAGIFLYDRLGGAKSVPAQKHLTRAGALRLSPGLKRSSLIGGIRYYDTVVDDARHTMTVARTAAHYGAVVRSSTQVVAMLREGDRVTGVRVRDSEDGAITEVRGHVVVNATGVWTDEIQALSKQRGRFQVRASKGVHVVVPRDRIVSDVAIILRTEKSVMFVIPWGSHWIIGTTDTDWNLDLAHPAATKADIDYILQTVNTVLATPLTHADIDGVYAGLRPLLAGESEETSKLSREHAVAVPAPGLVAIAGGKYTTYRVMAADAIDAAAQFIPARVAPSITEKVSLLGADGYFALINQAEHVGELQGLHPYRVRHLLDRYGSLIGDVLALAAESPDLLNPIKEAPGYLRVEALYAVVGRGRSASGGHPGPPDADLHRIPAPRRRLRPRGGRHRRAGAGLVGRGRRARGRELHRAGGGRDPVAGPARRRVRRRVAGQRARGPRRDPRAGAAQVETSPRRCRCATDWGPARVRLHGGPVLAELTARFGAQARAKVLAGEVVDADGAVIDATTVLPAGAVCLPLSRIAATKCPSLSTSRCCTSDADIVVVDKPHFLATMPRGRHVAQTALVRLRRELGMPELSPAHRLDRLTAGVLLFTTRRERARRLPDAVRPRFGAQDYLAAGAGRPGAGACRAW